MSPPDPDGSWDWTAARREQRRAWLATSAGERLRWLEEALAFANEAGALDRDRRRRADAARAWDTTPPNPSEDRQDRPRGRGA